MFSKANIKRFFFQLLTIAAGVYLGLIAGNWNDARKLKKAQSTFLKNIKNELESNIKRLEWSITQHEKLKVSIDSISAVEDEGFLEQAFFKNNGFQMLKGWKGFGISSLTTNVFQTGLNTNVFFQNWTFKLPVLYLVFTMD